MTTILLTGATGQVGWELARTLLPLGQVVVPARNQFDLAQPESLHVLIDEVRPEELTIATVPARVAERGDPWTTIDDEPSRIC